MNAIVRFLSQLWPAATKRRRYLLDDHHFNLTVFEGDVSEWLVKFPVNSENIEIYSALAELFRRRGEFDKAVAVHEAISQSQPEGYNPTTLTLEVAQDYYAAGLMGQAEDVLIKALGSADETAAKQAFRLWLNILESEQDWARAVELVEQYGITGSGGLRLANLYCEYALSHWRQKPKNELLKILKKARKLKISARVEILTAELLSSKGQVAEAIQVYRDLMQADPRRVASVLPLLKNLTLMNNSQEQLVQFLVPLYHQHPSVRILELLLELHDALGEPLPRSLQQAVLWQLNRGDSAVVVKYWLKHNHNHQQDTVQMLLPAIERHAIAKNDLHICVECGFQSETIIWYCPQCKSWETLYSQYELKIEQEIKKLA